MAQTNQYYYPFFSDREFCSEEPCSLERHTGTETYAGLIDEYKLGISLIFYVQFSLAYKKYLRTSAPVDFRGTAITAFADEGMVLLPVTKAVEADPTLMNRRHEEEQLLEAAIQGDPEAIETLTKAVNLQPDNIAITASIGNCYMYKAQEAVERATANNKSLTPDAEKVIVGVYMQAIEYLEKAKDMDKRMEFKSYWAYSLYTCCDRALGADDPKTKEAELLTK